MKSLSNRRLAWALIVSLSIMAAPSIVASAQSAPVFSLPVPSVAVPTASMQPKASEEAALLPDAPDAFAAQAAAASFSSSEADPAQNAAAASTSTHDAATGSLPEASRTQKYIEPNQAAPSLTPGDKILLGLRDAVSPFSAIGWISSAGYEQLVNGSPNYGTDRGAFGQRLGAAAIRDISEGILSDSVMSPLLHEDPRYYRLGNTHGFFPRIIYAATRTVITRTDSGRLSPNFALIAGNLGGAALTNLYYPQLNRGPVQTLQTFGGSMGGSAIGDLVTEFYTDVMHHLHHSQP